MVLKTRSCNLFTTPSKSSPREAIIQKRILWKRLLGELCEEDALKPASPRRSGDQDAVQVIGAHGSIDTDGAGDVDPLNHLAPNFASLSGNIRNWGD